MERLKTFFLNILQYWRKRNSYNIDNLIRKYDIPLSGIVHLGGNIGNESGLYHTCGFQKVIWIEGYTPFYLELVSNLESYPNQKAFNTMLSDIDHEKICFNVASNKGSSTGFSPSQSFAKNFPEIVFEKKEYIEARRLDEFFRENNIDVSEFKTIVADLEGYELKAFRGAGKILDGFDWIITEISIGNNFIGGPQLYEIDEFMISMGFNRLDTRIGLTSGDAIYKRQRITIITRIKLRISMYLIYFASFFRIYELKVIIKKWLNK